MDLLFLHRISNSIIVETRADFLYKISKILLIADIFRKFR